MSRRTPPRGRSAGGADDPPGVAHPPSHRSECGQRGLANRAPAQPASEHAPRGAPPGPAPARCSTAPRGAARRRASSHRSIRTFGEFRFGAGQPRQRLIVLLGALVLVLALVLFKVGVLQTSEGQALRARGHQAVDPLPRCARRSRHHLRSQRRRVGDVGRREQRQHQPEADRRSGGHGDDPHQRARPDRGASARSWSPRWWPRRPGSCTSPARSTRRSASRSRRSGWRASTSTARASGSCPAATPGRSVIGKTDIDGVGTGGLELQFDDLLTGTDGRLEREVAPGGRSIAGSETVSVPPIAGDDLVLTLDRSDPVRDRAGAARPRRRARCARRDRHRDGHRYG